ncbi:hypothetical protein KRR39_09055 [Nocardioides panacis]|uniref:Uncharacterized protein n=1 Tax=Nocardioides panacis TaxID=2849501 RepID=A0A975T1G7_9ACTN|nr:hypothetical protein [Nocardioides panacis]QWZ09854.1 hypothetical protein KRR39_09055 [Nocardioides panacis]
MRSEDDARNGRFDALFAEAAPLVSAQRGRRDSSPRPRGRWPASVMCRPPAATAEVLESWMWQALDRAGAGHYRTGLAGCSHLTVRALEPRCEGRTGSDPVALGWRRALSRAAATTAPLRFELTGVTLAAGSVMAQLEPVDAAPWLFMAELAQALGPLASHEHGRDIWYVNLVHFTGPIADPGGLVEWVAGHRSVPPVRFAVPDVELVTFDLAPDGVPAIVPQTLAREVFGAAARPARPSCS